MQQYARMIESMSALPAAWAVPRRGLDCSEMTYNPRPDKTTQPVKKSAAALRDRVPDSSFDLEKAFASQLEGLRQTILDKLMPEWTPLLSAAAEMEDSLEDLLACDITDLDGMQKSVNGVTSGATDLVTVTEEELEKLQQEVRDKDAMIEEIGSTSAQTQAKLGEVEAAHEAAKQSNAEQKCFGCKLGLSAKKLVKLPKEMVYRSS